MKIRSLNSLVYGLVLVAVGVLGLVVMEVTGQNKTFEHSPVAAITTFVAPWVVLFFGLRARRAQQEGQLSYRQGLWEGFKISLVYSILSPLVALGYYTLINPGIVASVREVYQLTGAGDGAVIGVDLLVQLATALVWGTVGSAVLSAFLRRPR